MPETTTKHEPYKPYMAYGSEWYFDLPDGKGQVGPFMTRGDAQHAGREYQLSDQLTEQRGRATTLESALREARPFVVSVMHVARRDEQTWREQTAMEVLGRVDAALDDFTRVGDSE